MKCPHCRMPVAIAAGKPFYTTAQAAAIAKVSAQTIINWVEAGFFPAARVGKGGRRVMKRPFLEYLAKYDATAARDELALLDQEGE